MWLWVGQMSAHAKYKEHQKKAENIHTPQINIMQLGYNIGSNGIINSNKYILTMLSLVTIIPAENEDK